MYREMMTFAEYGDELAKLRTRQYPMCGNNVVYPAMGCAGEAGELLDKIKKHWRNQTKHASREASTVVANMSAECMSPELKQEIVKEMGDVLWYLWALSEEIGVSLSSVAFENVVKIADRKQRDVVCSEGDSR